MVTILRKLEQLLKQTDSPEEARALLTKLGLPDAPGIRNSLRRLMQRPHLQEPFRKLFPPLIAALREAANPDQAAVKLEHLLEQASDAPALLQRLGRHPRRLETLITVLGASQFLGDILLRQPEVLSFLEDPATLSRPRGRELRYAEVLTHLEQASSFSESLDALRRFQRRELFRIGVADLLGLMDLRTVTAELSHLADALVQACLHLASRDRNTDTAGFAVIALGKLGGRELNYSSDIDLVFVAREAHPRFHRLGQRLIAALTHMTPEGFLYRVDMRLRPWGNAGALVPALPEYMDYLRRHARLWELQALVKARWIAGDEEVGLEFIEQAREKIFGPFLRERYSVEEIRREIHTMKSRIELELRRRQKMNGEVKSGQGSIRDVEFVTQFLQLLQGQEHSEIRNRNTLDALARLAASGLLPMEDYRVLADGYTFLRSVEHALQIMHNRQVHRLPEGAREMAYLARRLGFSGAQLDEQLHTRYREHREAIREVYQRYIEQGLPLVSPISSGESSREEKSTAPAPEASSGHCARMDASYAQTFSPEEIHHHGELIRQLGQSQWVVVEARPLEGSTYRVTIVGYDYPGELSLICGLFLVHGMNIIDGHIFTYESENSSPAASPGPASRRRRRSRFGKRADGRRKIVDVFTVAPVSGTLPENFWHRYAEELNHLVHHLRERSPEKAHGELARRVAAALEKFGFPEAPLLSVDIEIDNTVSDRYTVLRIDAPDTVGFLYELTNALALNGIYIGRVIVNSLGERVHDTLFVCDPHGNKITDPHKQQQLRAATALVKQFTHLLPQSPNPEAALLHFRELVSGLFSRPDWPKELASLERPEVLDALARLLGGCEFLWEDFLRLQHAHLFPFLRNMALLEQRVGKPELRRRLRESLAQETDFSRRQQALNLFKDREMFRIDMRYILGYSRFEVFSRELSDLAEVVVEAALEMCYRSLQERHGRPRLEEGTPCRYALCALGKFGGRELGFASDIELMLVYEGEGHTDGEAPLTNGEFFGRAVDGLCDTIRSRREGIFEIDLRLRPYGKAGRKAVTRASFGEYFAPEGPAWPYERQALVKLRPVAGDRAFGEALVRLRDSLIYTGRPFDVRAMRGMRERQVRQLVSGGTINAKFSPGGLVDVEYLVQALQITHGHRHPELRHPATLTALKVLGEKGIIDAEEQKVLEEAYIFLRRLIEGLRMVRGNARDLTVPDPHSEEFVFLARRLGYEKNPRELYQALLHHTAAVEKLSRRLLP